MNENISQEEILTTLLSMGFNEYEIKNAFKKNKNNYNIDKILNIIEKQQNTKKSEEYEEEKKIIQQEEQQYDHFIQNPNNIPNENAPPVKYGINFSVSLTISL